MLRTMPGGRTSGLIVSAAVVAFGAMSATATAAQTLCIGDPSGSVSAPRADGTCKGTGAVAKTLAEQSEVDALKATVAALESQVSTLEATLSKVSYNPAGPNGQPTLVISGANLQIVDGTGSTAGTVNGRGNLFVGYNEFPTGGDPAQTGSHNLVVGSEHSFTSYGGLIAGWGNSLRGPWASVSGGTLNSADGNYSSVSGGLGSNAVGDSSSVSGGYENLAIGEFTSVSGGYFNAASGRYSSVSGGARNHSSGESSSVSGGRDNVAEGSYSSVSGGSENTASGEFSSILGGQGPFTLATNYATYPGLP